MPHALDTIDWRLKRADEHLATLNRERRAFLDQKDRRVVGHFDRETSEYVFRFTGDVPERCFGLIISELAHHLRAALDNLLWQLVLLRGGCPTRDTEFPIWECAKRYADKAPIQMRGISADDRALIETCQPYHIGEDPANTHLAQLRRLNNVDKHRFLHIVCAVPETIRIPVFFEDEPAGQFPWWMVRVRDVGDLGDIRYSSTTPFEDRAELVRVSICPTGPNPHMEMKGHQPIDIALSDSEYPLRVSRLIEIRHVVGRIIEAFRPRFNV